MTVAVLLVGYLRLIEEDEYNRTATVMERIYCQMVESDTFFLSISLNVYKNQPMIGIVASRDAISACACAPISCIYPA